MVRFAHVADCHLGSWRQPELQELNFDSFIKVVDRIILEKPDFALFSGDIFDSAYPPIEILKHAFSEFKRLSDANIPVYTIAGSHDYSASGKTFLDVLAKAGLCTHVDLYREVKGRIELLPTRVHGVVLYGYPGRKSGMEIDDLKRCYIQEDDVASEPRILLLHTTIGDVVGNFDMVSIRRDELPRADYYAMGHVHQRFEFKDHLGHFVYSGPTYPNNFQELVDLEHGSFMMVETTGSAFSTERVIVKVKDVVYLEVDIDNGLTATDSIIDAINKIHLSDKVFLLRLVGTLHTGKTGDIRFNEIEDFIRKKGVYVFLRNISQIRVREVGSSSLQDFTHVELVEEEIVKEFAREHPHDFNSILPELMQILSIEQTEEEKSAAFEDRLISELSPLLKLEGML